jgi:hypothetical protein
MAVVSLFLANQLKAIVQGEALVNEINAAGYKPVTDLIANNTMFVPSEWTFRMINACAEARSAWTDRELADGDWVENNGDVRDVVVRANKWRTTAGAALRYAVARGVPGAAAILRRAPNIDVQVDSYESQSAELPVFFALFERVNHTSYDLSKEFLDEGRQIVATMVAERADADGAKGARASETSDLGEAMVRIANIAEELAAARALAAARTGKDIPGFDLTYIRAAAAAHSTPAQEEGEGDKDDDKDEGGL